jgi:hypothetical protein
MSNFTPAPWYAVIYDGLYDQPLITNDSGNIARVMGLDNRMHEANARLIAKAPEMYKLLKLIKSRTYFEDTFETEAVTTLLEEIDDE